MMEATDRQIENVLVTIVSRKMKSPVDMRCPCHKPVELLGQEILLLLNEEYGPDIDLKGPIRISFNGKPIPTGKTLASVGAWDGSYLYID